MHVIVRSYSGDGASELRRSHNRSAIRICACSASRSARVSDRIAVETLTTASSQQTLKLRPAADWRTNWRTRNKAPATWHVCVGLENR